MMRLRTNQFWMRKMMSLLAVEKVVVKFMSSINLLPSTYGKSKSELSIYTSRVGKIALYGPKQ